APARCGSFPADARNPSVAGMVLIHVPVDRVRSLECRLQAVGHRHRLKAALQPDTHNRIVDEERKPMELFLDESCHVSCRRSCPLAPLKGRPEVTVNDSTVFTESDVVGQAVKGCQQVNVVKGEVMCTFITRVLSGRSEIFSRGGSPVLLRSARLLT